MAFGTSHTGLDNGLDHGLIHLHASGAWTFTPQGDDRDDSWDSWGDGTLIAVAA